jgi:hypothetical protein
MDVSGKAPSSEVGEYFRANLWWWRPLWDYCRQVSPEIVTETVHRDGSFNDGAGLDAEHAAKLAEALRAEIASGDAASYIEEYEAERKAIPQLECKQCHGSGYRDDEVAANIRAKNPEFKCNGCQGSGKQDDLASWYPMSLDFVEKFTEFVAASGGFEIW